MSSSTDVLSGGNIHSLEGESDVCSTLRPRKAREKLAAEIHKEEIQSEIDDLVFNVPEVEKHFKIHNKIGAGTFSSVFVASLKRHCEIKEKFALKHILPTSLPDRIENELRCLMEIGGCDNVIGVKACLRHQDHVVIIMPHFPHDKFMEYFQEMTLTEIKEYMKNLLLALRRVHKFDVIHRDVKPTNFLCNRKLKTFALVDFGLAHKVTATSSAKSMKSPLGTATSSAKSMKSPLGRGGISGMSKGMSPESLRTPPRSTDVKTSSQGQKRKADVLSPGEENVTKSARHSRTLTEMDLNKMTPVAVKGKTDEELAKSKGLFKDVRVVLDGKALSAACPAADREQSLALNPPDPFSPRAIRSPRRMLLTKQLHLSQKTGLQITRPMHASRPGLKTALVVHSGGKAHYTTVAPTSCTCFGQPTICNICMSRKHQVAARAGTPGFRAPEVLLKCPDQTTAVDIWSAGVIFLSILCQRNPFFKAGDDMTALAQILTVFGSDAMKLAARSYGKELTCNPTIPGVNLANLINKLRQHGSDTPQPKSSSSSRRRLIMEESMTEETIDLLQQLLDLNPLSRITAAEALNHPYFKPS